MREESEQNLKNLPQMRVLWQLTLQKLHKWVPEPGEMASQPYVLMISIPESKSLLKTRVLSEPPDIQQIEEIISNTIKLPEGSPYPPHRPQRIAFNDRKLMEQTTDFLAGLEIEQIYQPEAIEADEAIAFFEGMIEESLPDIPGLLSVPGATPEKMWQWFDDAAAFFQSRAWGKLSERQPVAVHFSPVGKQGYVQVLGQAGVQVCLNLFWEWEALMRLLVEAYDPFEQIPEGGFHSLSFEAANMIPSSDLDAIEEYGWRIAAVEAYPLPCIYDSETVERPTLEELAYFQAITQALPAFTEALQSDGKGDYLPRASDSDYQTITGTIKLNLRYPAGELPMLPDFEEMFDEELELEDEPDLSAGMDTEQVDVRILEAEMALHVNDLYAFREAPVREAQQLVIRSWRTGDATERLLLAHQALEISPLCADALVLLAEEEAETIEEALAYYQRALLAAETALGEGYEQEYAGQFWEKYETHPLFRALEGLANTLAEMGKSETSLRYYRQLMRFDPDDHLGARYGTLHVLMTLKDYAAAHQLIHSFPNELSAFWSYTHALVAFINQGSSKRSDNMLRWARRQNPHVPAYLMGEKKLPEEYPTSFAAGDEVEAAYYAADYYSFWWNIPGAIEWLKADKFLTTIVK